MTKEAMIEFAVYTLAGVLGFFGVMFVMGAQGQPLRIVVGAVLLAAAGMLIYLTRVRPRSTTTVQVQKIDLSGDVNLEKLQCKSCKGTLSKKSISVQAGAVLINCEYCGTGYQLEEEPKW